MHAHLRDDELPHARGRVSAATTHATHRKQARGPAGAPQPDGWQDRPARAGADLLRMPGDEADHRRPLGALEVKEGQDDGRASLRHGAEQICSVHEIHRLSQLDERQILEGRHRLDSTTKLAIRPEDRLEALELVQGRTERQKPHEHGRRHVHDQESVHIDARVQEQQGNREE